MEGFPSEMEQLRDRRRVSLGDQIYKQLRDSIVFLHLKPGQMVYENEIAEQLKVSRTPVREAFRLLMSEQLIDIQPQRGTKVNLISVRKIEEARFIREHLEIGAFRLAANMWNEQIARTYETQLLALLEQQQLAVEDQDAAGLLKYDEDFHKLILTITGNQTLLQVIDHMRAHINRIRFLVLHEFRHMERIVAEHREILESLRAGRTEQTAELLSKHFRKLDRELPELRAAFPQYFAD